MIVTPWGVESGRKSNGKVSSCSKDFGFLANGSSPCEKWLRIVGLLIIAAD